MDAVSAALEGYYNQAESPPMSPTTMRTMASAADTNCTSLARAETSPPRFAGMRSLRALSGLSPPTTDSDRFQQDPSEAVLITRLVPKSNNVVPLEDTCEPSPNDKKRPSLGYSSTKAEKPTVPENFSRLAPRAKLKAVKQFLSTFEYKQTPATHFNTHKLRPLTRIMDTARMIIYSPQPIKCVEAVFLALYLTAGIPDCDRTPLGFKTSLNGQVFQHIVLLVQYGGKFGAFGISRQPDLMNKDLTFNSITNIVENYKTAYEAAGHTLLKIRVGLPVEHKIQSPNYVCWRHLSLSPGVQSWEQCCEALENHVLKKNRLWDLARSRRSGCTKYHGRRKDVNTYAYMRLLEKYLDINECGDLVLYQRLAIQVGEKLDQLNSSAEQFLRRFSGKSLRQTFISPRRWLLAGKGGDPRRKSLDRKAALDTKVLVKDGVKKKKKVKTQGTTMKSFAETEQVVSKSEVRKSPGNVPVLSNYAEAKASKERKRGASLAATKSLMKTRLLQSRTSFLIRQSAQYIAPKLLAYRNIPLSRGSLSLSQTKRPSKVSFSVDDGKRDLTDMTSKGKEQAAGGRRLSKGKEQISTGTRSKGKLRR